MTSNEFLRSFYDVNNTDSFSINYRIAEGYPIQSIEINIAVKKLEKDIEEMKQFFRDFGIDENKAEEATYSLWSKSKLVRFS